VSVLVEGLLTQSENSIEVRNDYDDDGGGGDDDDDDDDNNNNNRILMDCGYAYPFFCLLIYATFVCQ
jgi:hypothetical protein